MNWKLDRRNFCGNLGVALGLGIARRYASGAPSRRLKIGHTGITWGFKPEDAPRAIQEVATLGYTGYETFGEYLDAWEAKGGLRQFLDPAKLPLISAYCNVNLTDASRRKEEVDRSIRWARLIQKTGGVTAVILLLSIFAACRLLISWFPMDEPGAERTTHGQRHGALALVTFASIALAATDLGRRLDDTVAWHRLAAVSSALGIAIIVLLVLMGLGRAAPTLRTYFGLVERGFYLAAISWTAVFAVACAERVH